MVRLGGVSKATIVRVALIDHLSTFGVLFPEAADTLHSTQVSRWMGHASASTTDTIYGHLYPTDYDDQIARFEAFVTAR